MRSRLVVVRLLLMLVLAASPLVSSAVAAESGAWSQVWANPFDGRVQAAEEEEAGGHDTDDLAPGEIKAVAWDMGPHRLPAASYRHGSWERQPVDPAPAADPAPPPEGA